MGSGMNAGACDTAHWCISEPLAIAPQKNLCGYAIFADIKSAFAPLHRRVAIMDDLGGDEKWLLHLKRCRFSSEQAANIMSLAIDLLEWQEAGGSEHSFAIVCEAQHNT